MSTKILITGATGLIGFRVLLAALEAGYSVRFTARSEKKAEVVTSNPAVQNLTPGDRLTSILVPDYTAPGAFDAALKDITHVVHVGSPVPAPQYDPKTDVFDPTVKGVDGLLGSALKTPSVKRVLITSSIVANMAPMPDPTVQATATSRFSLPGPPPDKFTDVFEAYILGKIVEINATDKWIEKHLPHFSVSHVIPGYVFGRNELCLTPEAIKAKNSSNGFLMLALTGGDVAFPIHGAYAHIDDVAEVHLKVTFLDPVAGEPKDFGIATNIDYASANAAELVAKKYPKAVEDGVFGKGNILTLPVDYDSSATEQALGLKLRSFDSAVLDVANQYLELLGKPKA